MTKNEKATRGTGATDLCVCEACGDTFTPRKARSGRRKRFCSGTCRQRARRSRIAPASQTVRTHLMARLQHAGADETAEAITTLDDADLVVLSRAMATIERVLHVQPPPIPTPPAEPVDAPAAAPTTPTTTAAASATVPAPSVLTRAPIDGLRPTDEQAAIIDACTAGDNLVIEAGAGTGKTSTLRMAASLMTNRKGLYVAFNKAIATEAARTFGSNVSCSTAHSLAYKSVGHRFRRRLNGPRVPAWQVAQRLGLVSKWVAGDVAFSPDQQARLALQMTARYCRSADDALTAAHAPWVAGLSRQQHRGLGQHLLPLAQRIWADQSDPGGEQMPFTHDVYLKLWALTKPTLNADFILFDEAQDADPLIAAVVQSQQAQLVGVGDSCQAIYGWRGATDALAQWPADTRLYLTESWRFGAGIADEANKWLHVLGAKLRLAGRGQPSQLGPVQADAVLCRTNAEAMSHAIAGMDAGRRVALVGGGAAIRSLAEASQSLQAGLGTTHPELMAFSTWEQLRQYVRDDDSGADLATLVRLVDRTGAEAVIHACKRLSAEKYADLTVSTAHKAKGREWDRVYLADDFREPKADDNGRPGRIPADEAMLTYVAVTRARTHLDANNVSWINNYLPQQ